MAIDTLIAPLLRVRIFQGLTPLQLSEIARRSERIMIRPGDLITQAGQPADAAVLIVAGPSERIIESVPGRTDPVEPGSLIGEMAMFVDHIYGSTVRATGPVKAMRLTRAAMHEHMLADQAMTDHLVAKISSRLNAVATDLRQLDDMLAKPFRASQHQSTPFAENEHLRPIAPPDQRQLTYVTH